MNKELDKMVNALINGDNEAAKTHLSTYFNDTGAKLMQDDEPVVDDTSTTVTEQAYNVYKSGKLIDTVFDSSDDAADVKKSLIDHDGYDSDITVKKAKAKPKD